MVFFIIFFIILNSVIYLLLSKNRSLKYHWLFMISLFIFINVIVKCYNRFWMDKLLDGFGFFILLLFSLSIPILNLIKRNNKNILKNTLEKNNVIPRFKENFDVFNYVLIITILVTIFQIYMVLSEKVNLLH